MKSSRKTILLLTLVIALTFAIALFFLACNEDDLPPIEEEPTIIEQTDTETKDANKPEATETPSDDPQSGNTASSDTTSSNTENPPEGQTGSDTTDQTQQENTSEQTKQEGSSGASEGEGTPPETTPPENPPAGEGGESLTGDTTKEKENISNDPTEQTPSETPPAEGNSDDDETTSADYSVYFDLSQKKSELYRYKTYPASDGQYTAYATTERLCLVLFSEDKDTLLFLCGSTQKEYELWGARTDEDELAVYVWFAEADSMERIFVRENPLSIQFENDSAAAIKHFLGLDESTEPNPSSGDQGQTPSSTEQTPNDASTDPQTSTPSSDPSAGEDTPSQDPDGSSSGTESASNGGDDTSSGDHEGATTPSDTNGENTSSDNPDETPSETGNVDPRPTGDPEITSDDETPSQGETQAKDPTPSQEPAQGDTLRCEICLAVLSETHAHEKTCSRYGELPAASAISSYLSQFRGVVENTQVTILTEEEEEYSFELRYLSFGDYAYLLGELQTLSRYQDRGPDANGKNQYYAQKECDGVHYSLYVSIEKEGSYYHATWKLTGYII